MRLLIVLLFASGCVSAQSTFTSGGKLKPEQAIMDIRHYGIDLDVDISQKTISGRADIDFMLTAPTQVLLFDLLDSMNVESVWVNGKKNAFTHKNNLITIDLPYTLSPGRENVKVQYSGT